MVDRGIGFLRIIFVTGFIILCGQIIFPIVFNSEPKLVANASEILIVNPTLKVHLIGAIKNPGIYHLPKGARIMDAIVKAGGIGKDANLNSLNLAEMLIDGERIYIPTKQEEINKNMNTTIKPDINKDLKNKNSNVNKTISPNTKININKADADELATLPSIGPKLAKNIIEHRQKSGYFKQIEELKNIPGIGEKRFSRIKNLITVK